MTIQPLAKKEILNAIDLARRDMAQAKDKNMQLEKRTVTDQDTVFGSLISFYICEALSKSIEQEVSILHKAIVEASKEADSSVASSAMKQLRFLKSEHLVPGWRIKSLHHAQNVIKPDIRVLHTNIPEGEFVVHYWDEANPIITLKSVDSDTTCEANIEELVFIIT